MNGKGQSPVPGSTRPSSIQDSVRSRIRQGRCQPRPWIVCGEPARLGASWTRLPFQSKPPSRMRLHHGTSGKLASSNGEPACRAASLLGRSQSHLGLAALSG